MLEVRNLTKMFGWRKVVDNISFNVEKGEILGFLGPNGAGKSTSMRMITGFIPPTSGTAIIGGDDILADPIAAQKKIGYLPENAPVYPDMTVSGYLGFAAEIRGFKGKELQRKVEEALEKCFLSDVKHQTIQTLSKGFKQRVCFAQSIIHDPEYLILDEPTDGLDPNQKHEVRLMIRKMSEQKAIILSTHILDEMEAVCTRAIIIAQGKIVCDDTPYNLKTQSSLHGAVSLSLNEPLPADVLTEIEQINGVKFIKVLESNHHNFSIRIYPETIVKPLVGEIIAKLSVMGLEVKSVFVEQGRLDDVFRNLTAPRTDTKETPRQG